MKEENAPAQPADADLPPQVQTDQYLLEAEKTLKNNDIQTAKTAFKKIEALNIKEPPPDFFFLYGKFLMENCNVANLAKVAENGQVQNFLDNLLKARSLLKQFLTQVQRTAANYRPGLELLSACQSTIKAVTPAAKEFEELQTIKKKRAGETLLIHLAACYSELVNTIIGAEEIARLQQESRWPPITTKLWSPCLTPSLMFMQKTTMAILHEASWAGQIQVVESLLAAGANLSAKNKKINMVRRRFTMPLGKITSKWWRLCLHPVQMSTQRTTMTRRLFTLPLRKDKSKW